MHRRGAGPVPPPGRAPAMKVLVVGAGAREHALCWRLARDPVLTKLLCAPGNPGINRIAEPVGLAPSDIAGLARFAAQSEIDLTVVGPEEPLALGIVDQFERHGLAIFGPSGDAARLEASKSFAKTVMREAGVPTGDFEVFDDPDRARRYVRQKDRPLVVKADGLALGKGVTVCDDAESALAAITEAMEHGRFGPAGRRVVIEERLFGEELSFFALADGESAVPLGFVQDHKAVFDDDRGPNTGGMGAYSPVPHFGAGLERRVMDEVVGPTLGAMRARATPFRGVLFVGVMVRDGIPRVLEFNVRLGDPECEALMMRFTGGLAETLMAAARRRLTDAPVALSPGSAVAVVLASAGYPGEYRKGLEISGLERVASEEASEARTRWAREGVRVEVFHAGTRLDGGRLVTSGGRVLTVTAMADGLRAAVDAAYEAAAMIEFEGKHLRGDIARKALVRLGAHP